MLSFGWLVNKDSLITLVKFTPEVVCLQADG